MTSHLTIDSLAHGGDGVAKLDGQVVFVPGTVPGDKVTARITWHQKGAFGRASQVVVDTPSELRQEPSCKHHPLCGGCPWHEVSANTAAQAKASNAVEALRRIAGITCQQLPTLLPKDQSDRMETAGVSIVGAGRQLGYRPRARFTLVATKTKTFVGFRRPKSNKVVDIETCALLLPHLQEAVKKLLGLCRDHRWPGGKLHVAADHNKCCAVFVPRRPANPARLCRDMLAAGFAGAEVTSPTAERVDGSGYLAGDTELSGVVAAGISKTTAQHDALTFTQPNIHTANVVSQAVQAALAQSLERQKLDPSQAVVWELFAGAGHLTLVMAQMGLSVYAVEQGEREARFLTGNVDRFGLQDKVHLGRQDATDVEGLLGNKWPGPDVLVLDPTRAGYPQIAPLVEQTSPKSIVYVSCDPASQARDIKGLVKKGWSTVAIEILDQLPGSWHVETVLLLEKPN